ncbi:hypothetical protein SAMN05446935_8025 [Burkholderia sp. YR290]|nr:hypothetical protein SAMN05446935_8025 [Burkholderia sp. YR290]
MMQPLSDMDRAIQFLTERRRLSYNSKLAQYREAMSLWRRIGFSYADISAFLAEKGVRVTPDGVRKHFVRADERAKQSVQERQVAGAIDPQRIHEEAQVSASPSRPAGTLAPENGQKSDEALTQPGIYTQPNEGTKEAKKDVSFPAATGGSSLYDQSNRPSPITDGGATAAERPTETVPKQIQGPVDPQSEAYQEAFLLRRLRSSQF